MRDTYTAAVSARRACRQEIQERVDCYKHQKDGKNTEECFREELTEKRCLSFYCCPRQAKKFYGSPAGSEEKALCSLWAEAFAFTVNDGKNSADDIFWHSEGREFVNQDVEDRKKCRTVLMDLTKCMSAYSKDFQKLKSKDGQGT